MYMYMYFQFRRAWLSLWYVHTYIYMNIYLCICVCMYMYIQFWRPWLSSWSNDSQRGNRARDTRHSDVWNDTSIEFVKQQQPVWKSCVWHGVCGETHSDVCHEWFGCVPWLFQMCAMTHSNVCHGSFMRVTWLIQMCAMTHLHFYTHLRVCHDSLSLPKLLPPVDVHIFETIKFLYS